MNIRLVSFVALIALAPLAPAKDTVHAIGSSNTNLSRGAQALLAGRHDEGIRLTLRGLDDAISKREKEVALSNLCAGYTNKGDFQSALKYCNRLLEQNDQVWQAHNSKALIYIYTGQLEKAEESLRLGEAIRPDAPTMKTARKLYEDAMNPVAPVIEVDDRREAND